MLRSSCVCVIWVVRNATKAAIHKGVPQVEGKSKTKKYSICLKLGGGRIKYRNISIFAVALIRYYTL